MSYSTDQHLCLTDLLDQDLSSYEYFHSLPEELKKKLERRDVSTFAEMQEFVEAERLKQ